MANVSITPGAAQRTDPANSEMLDAHGTKRSAEEAVREGLRSLGGSWAVNVVVSEVSGWWLVFIHSEEDGFTRTLLLEEPSQRTPEYIAVCVAAAVAAVRLSGTKS